MQIMRFTEDRTKNEKEIRIPEIVHIPVSDGIINAYKLIAIINHVQFDDGKGHYTTVIRNVEGNWKLYNDSKVKKFQLKELDLTDPYVVFYQLLPNETAELDSDVSDDDWQPFKRNTEVRSTNINTKRRVKSDGTSIDISADIPVTNLRHKARNESYVDDVSALESFKRPPCKSETKNETVTDKNPPKLPATGIPTLTTEQKEKLKAWCDAERKGRYKMPKGGRKRLIELIRTNWNIQCTSDQLSRIMARESFKKNKNRPVAFPFTTVEKIKSEFPSMKWPQIYEKLVALHPNFAKRTAKSLQMSYSYFEKSKKKGKWTEDEIKLLLEQFNSFRTKWSKYEVPNRCPDQIRGKFFRLLSKLASTLSGKCFSTYVLESIDTLIDIGEPATKSNLIEDLLQKSNIKSLQLIRFMLNRTLQNLMSGGRIKQVDDEYVLNEKSERPKLDGLKRAPPQPLRGPLNEEEKQHLADQIKQCSKSEKKKSNKSSWFGNEKLLNAVTTHIGPRSLSFESSEGVFEEDEVRNMLEELLTGESLDLEDTDDADTIDFMENKKEKLDFQTRVFGVLRFTNSKKILFFFTTHKNVYKHFKQQLYNISTLICCPSWLQAVITDRGKIDWKNIHILTIAEGLKAAVRLKLATVRLTNNPCYNVRQQTFVEITSGFRDYETVLNNTNISLSEISVAEMLANAGNVSKKNPE